MCCRTTPEGGLSTDAPDVHIPALETVEGRSPAQRGRDRHLDQRGRSYKGPRRRPFSFRESGDGGLLPGVWVVKADDLTRARVLLRDAGLIDSTRGESSLQHPPNSQSGVSPRRMVTRVRLVVLALLAIAVAITLSRGCSEVRKPTPPADPRHIVPVDLSQA